MSEKTEMETEVAASAEPVDNIDKFLRNLAASSSSTGKQEKILEKLINSEGLLEKYLKRSPECKELFTYLDDTTEALNELSKSSVSLNINETNTEILLACIEKALVFYAKKHKLSLLTKKEDTPNQLMLVEKLDYRAKLNNLCTTLLNKYIKLISKCLLMKSSTKKTLTLQETCVRLLTVCVQQSADYAKQIAFEYEYFNIYKNWLERFLLMKQTDLREFSIQFLISYFKYTKVINSPEKKLDDVTVDHEYLTLLKKIFLSKSSAQPSKSNGKKAPKTPTPVITSSTLLHCLFSHINTDSFEALEFLLQEFLFKFVQNESFNKSEKIKLFNEKILGQLIKLFEWIDHKASKSSKDEKLEDKTLVVRQMIGEFFKVLFSSTKYGINFYDRTLNVDLSNKNYNHLIFNALIGIVRPVGLPKDKKPARILKKKTNEIIDELILKSLKVCPDLIQRFLKVKYKQETSKDSHSDDQNQEWFLKFCTRLFEQQHLIIKKMRKNLCGPTSFLRSLSVSSSIEELRAYLCDLIIHTSLPLCISFQKILTQIFSSKMEVKDKIERYNQSLRLLVNTLKCIKEWQECLRGFQMNKISMDTNDMISLKVHDNLTKILQSKSENFNSKLNLELLTKYLPKFDIFCDSIVVNQILSEQNDTTEEDVNSNSNMVIANSFDIFSLYFDVFMTRAEKPKIEDLDEMMNESEDLIGSCFNFLQIETLEQNLVRLIPALLQLGSDNLISKTTATSANSINLCLKYLKFLIKYLSLKQSEQCVDESTLAFDMNDSDSNGDLLFDSHLKIKTSDKSYLIDYKNMTILNLVKIVFKFKEQTLFKNLVGYFLNLAGVFIQNDQQNDVSYESSDIFQYDRNSMYLWFNLVRKHFIESSDLTSSELNLLIDYVYFCLNNLLSNNQRSFILFQLNMNNNQSLDAYQFNQLLVFISMKNYFVFNELIVKNDMPLVSLERIRSFLFDYIFSSSLIIENYSRENGSLSGLFDKYFSNQLLFKQESSEKLAKELKLKLNKKLEDITKKSDKADCSSEVFMVNFDKFSNLSNSSADKNLTIIDLNLNLRISHLLFLAVLSVDKTTKFTIETDLDLIVKNLKNCIDKISQLSSMSPASLQKITTDNIEVDDEAYHETINLKKHLDHIKAIFTSLKLDNADQIQVQKKINMDLLSEFSLDKEAFELIINEFEYVKDLETSKVMNDELTYKFEFFAKILTNNQNFIFEKDVSLFKEFDLDEKFIASLELLSKCVNVILSFGSKYDLNKTFSDSSNYDKIKSSLTEFLLKAYEYKPMLFKLLVKISSSEGEKSMKYLKKFSSDNEKLIDLLETCANEIDEEDNVDELTEAENEFLRLNSIDEQMKKSLNAKSLEKLVKLYKFTMSKKDQAILKRLYKLDPKLDCLLFKSQKSTAPEKASDNLEHQTKIADFITTQLNETSIHTACQNFPIYRKLDDLNQSTDNEEFNFETLILKDSVFESKIYDPIYLLPNIYRLLDYGNIVDVVMFVNSRCLSYLFSALSIEDKNLRALAYGSLYRFAMHLENSRAFFKNIIVYLITLLRNSSNKENLHLPTVISLFLSEAVMIVKEPGTTLYKPIISFILLKPALDLTNVPEYYKLFNSSSSQYKAERKWMLTILSHSCRTSLDFRLFEKRFVYRQLLAIYDSKISDMDTKLAILDVVFKTCNCKYALIDLIKRHYLIIWLSNVVEGNLSKKNSNEVSLQIFYKLVQIFVLIWSELGANRLVKNPETEKEELMPPPLTFLNQMFILMKSLLDKLVKSHTRLNELKLEVDMEGDEKLSLDLGKHVIKNFFKVKRELTERIQKFNLNLITFDSNDNMDKEFVLLKENSETKFIDVMNSLETRKRTCQHLFSKENSSDSKRIKV